MIRTTPTLESLEAELREVKEDVARLTEKRKWHSCRDFGILIGRSQQWVSDRVAAGFIRSLTDRPYRIPASEYDRVLSEGI